MLLSTQQASQILREMKSLVHHDINLIDTQGVIFASTNPAREGSSTPVRCGFYVKDSPS